MSKALGAGVALVALMLAAPANAAIVVVGNGPARACYEAAEDERTDAVSLRTCNFALTEAGLSRSDRAATYVNRGIIHAARGSHDAALADFEAAGRHNPNLAEAFTNRGQVLMRDAQYAPALEAFDRGISLGPREPEKAYYSRGVAHEEMGNIRAAYADYQRASELAPQWAPPRTELARFRVVPRN
jgi:tetratricopeptide (TPR) repeat protein